MERKYKEAIVREIQDNFKSSSSVIFYNYSKVVNEEIFLLRKKLKQVDSFWKVYKNNLVKKALPSVNLQQNNALIFCKLKEDKGENFLKTLKLLWKFEEADGKIKRIHCALDNCNNIIDSSFLISWAKLPERNKIIVILLFYIKFPIIRLIKILKKKSLI